MNKNFCRNVKIAIRLRGCHLELLGRKVGALDGSISNRTINRVVNGNTDAKLKHVQLIADVLAIEPGRLAFDDEYAFIDYIGYHGEKWMEDKSELRQWLRDSNRHHDLSIRMEQDRINAMLCRLEERAEELENEQDVG